MEEHNRLWPKNIFSNSKLFFGLVTVVFGILGYWGQANLESVNTASAQTGTIPAFPGAEGFGAQALASCDKTNIKVIEVTNLNSSGPGSWQDAIANQLRDGKLDVIVFRTGGTINAKATINKSCVYIAGQTAPGDGIQIVGMPALWFPGSGEGNNIVVRYLRLRSQKSTSTIDDVVRLLAGNNIVFDHVSMQWGNDEVMGIQPAPASASFPHDITVQRSIVAESLGTGILLGSLDNLSLHHNIFAHNRHRNPRGNAPNVQVVNNVIYNWGSRAGNTTHGAIWDYINNVYTKGPRSGENWLGHESCEFAGGSGTGTPYPDLPPSIYIEGNIFGTGSTPAANQWTHIRQDRTCAGNRFVRGAELPSSWRRGTPIQAAPIPVTLQPAADAKTSVLADVGANKRLSCDGSWVTVQDRVDADIIRHINTGTGPAREEEADHPDDFGGPPNLASGSSCPDADGDGLPDAWEQRYFNSPTAASISDDPDGEGYTNIEEYLNGTDPRVASTIPPVTPPGPTPPGTTPPAAPICDPNPYPACSPNCCSGAQCSGNLDCASGNCVLPGATPPGPTPPGPPTGPTPLPPGAARAFPEAEGHGALALNDCRSKPMVVHEVTNTNDSGPGSLQDIIQNKLSDSNFDIIIFRTGGTISGSPGAINKSCVYIAGQTAPGDGIQIVGGPALSIPRSGIGNNIVVRYMRFRDNKGTPGGGDLINVSGGHNMVFDHISLQWGNDEAISFNPAFIRSGGTPMHDITLQHMIIAETLHPHSTASIIGDNWREWIDDPKPPTSNFSVHHNIYAHNGHRNPRVGAEDLQVANNIIYNWGGKIGETMAAAKVDFVNNTYIPGPQSANNWLIHESCPRRDALVYPLDKFPPSFYIEGNIFGTGSTPAANQWTHIRQAWRCATTYAEKAELPSSWRRSTPIPAAPIPVTLQSAADAKNPVLADVGANRRLACNGDWVWTQDRVDADIINHIKTGTGPATKEENDHPDDHGGHPNLASGNPCPDTDKDSLPDAWETRYYGSPTGAPSVSTIAAGGYTVIEHYLNGSDPRSASGSANTQNLSSLHSALPADAQTLGICRPSGSGTPPPSPEALPPAETDIGPHADFSCTVVGLTVSCTDSSTPGVNPQTGDTEPIVYWGWRWGDGTAFPNQGSGGTVTHTYDHPDKYVIRLTVIDNLGRWDFHQIEVDLLNQTATEGVSSRM